MFTVKQAAEQLGVSVGLVYGLCAAGKIRHERFGLGRGTIRISEEAMEEYRQGAQGRFETKLGDLKHIKLR